MSLRTSSLVLPAFLLAACGSETPAPQGPEVRCAIGPGAELAEVCTLERTDPVEFIIHHPDGGFRRFVWADTGELTLADGAEPLSVTDSIDDPEVIEMTVGSDRYRLRQALVAASSDE